MTTICLITGSHLCRNPRVVKEATALADAGYSVTVLGPAFDETLATEDRVLAADAAWSHLVTIDLRHSSLAATRARLVRRLGCEAVQRFAVQTPAALGYGMSVSHRMARDVNANLYIGHQEIGLWAASRLAAEGRCAGVDIEDWYSADLLPSAQARRPLRLLRDLEAAAVRHLPYVTTTSRALSDALTGEYGGSPPAVVYNAFPWSDRRALDGMRRDRRDDRRPSLHWVSQTLGPGRGLELLFTALRRVEVPVAVHLRGHCSVEEERRLRALFPDDSGHTLFIHPLVSNDELLSRITEHDIGLALESYDPPSRQYTVTNKILHYLLGGLAVVATDTAGQREIAAAAPTAVRLCRGADPADVAAAINQLVVSPDALAHARRAALHVAETRFSWEHQVPVLLEYVKSAMAGLWPPRCATS